MNTCSKCGDSRVCECGEGNSNGVTMGSAGSKKQQKQKQPKILKRGPGVAELEKILREQEPTSDLPPPQRGNNGGFSISLSWPCPDSSVLHSHVPSVSLGIGSMYGGGESSERELFPMNHAAWESNGIQSDDSGSSPMNLSTAMVNQFHGNFMQQDEQKIVVGIMQTDTSSLDKSLIPQFIESGGVSSYNHNDEYYSDEKWGSTLELNNQGFNSEYDVSGDANFLQYAVSEIPAPAMPSSPSVHSDGHGGKPFFNFLAVKDEEELTDGNIDGIDLTLKL